MDLNFSVIVAAVIVHYEMRDQFFIVFVCSFPRFPMSEDIINASSSLLSASSGKPFYKENECIASFFIKESDRSDLLKIGYLTLEDGRALRSIESGLQNIDESGLWLV